MAPHGVPKPVPEGSALTLSRHLNGLGASPPDSPVTSRVRGNATVTVRPATPFEIAPSLFSLAEL